MSRAEPTLRLSARLDDACVRELAQGIARADDVIVLEGSEGQFCLGMDFQAHSGEAGLQRFADMLGALMTAPMPTLAIIDGPAYGGGLGVAAACDYVIATSRARIALPEALYGLAPAIIRPALLRRLTPGRLAMLVATCHSRSAEEALQLGLVDEVSDDPLAKHRALRNLRRASRDTIRTLRGWDAALIAEQLAAGVAETGAALARPAVRAALAEAM